MRRGFLNRPNALSADKNLPKKEKQTSTGTPKTAIPTGLIAPPVILNPNPLSEYTSKDCHWNVVSLPPPERMRIGEQQTICILLPPVKRNILAIPSFPGPALPFLSPPRYRMSAAPGAGFGIFATRDLKRGDVIIVERPLLALPQAMPVGPNVMKAEDILTVAVTGMRPADREKFVSLSNCKGSKCPEWMGILNTNALPIGALPGHNVTYCAVSRDISRVNHSCSSNAHVRWDLNTFTYSLSALRPIRAGEQIFIDYCDPLQKRTARRKELKSKYGFTCRCSSCGLPDRESAASDDRRLFLASRHLNPADETALKAWIRDFSLPDDYIISQCRLIWDKMEEEDGCGYHEHLWPALVQRICKAYCALGHLDGAREWAEKGAGFSKVYTGDDSAWKKVAAAPQHTAWWELRVKARALLAK